MTFIQKLDNILVHPKIEQKTNKLGWSEYHFFLDSYEKQFILFYLCEKQLKHSIMQQLMQCPTKGGKISNTQSRMLQKKKVYIHFFSRHETCLSILTIISCNLQLVNTYIQCDQITTLLLVSFYFVYKITKDYNFTRKIIEIFFTHQQLRNLNYKSFHWKLSTNQLSYNILNKNY